ncbi:potassium transporter Kup [Actinomyces haliotis]|uniref:potassium transporter Kup n=1 Tax=Actinomyces haliotis TaxID=1280843 RepID=UPI002B2710F1|nr:KUP/HAK/KT family potassium transporter [Actinomyces haliotis]
MNSTQAGSQPSAERGDAVPPSPEQSGQSSASTSGTAPVAPTTPPRGAEAIGAAAHRSPLAALVLAAIGVVFGDIGTSPLYSMQTVFSIDHNDVQPTQGDVYGVISMVFWSIAVIVSLKYVALVMRADNDGEGGILALVHLLRDRLADRRRLTRTVLMLGVIGAALFYGDSVITPAISVMSAVEGLQVVDSGAGSLVLPVSVVILTGLFLIQRKGTSAVGRAFGPVMIVWFLVLVLLGIPRIAEDPAILWALSPHHAVLFLLERPGVAFVALGACILTITGAEALYADMGHFGSRPIRLAWFALVFPALTVNYLGQGALILKDPTAISSPFYLLAPAWARLPLVVLATLATIIASQAVISGAFTVSRQANRLGLLPRLTVIQTSREEAGQIYVPAVNWLLFAGVLVLILIFRSSSRLADAYGLAVTGTFVLTSALFLLLARRVWHVAAWKWWFYAVLVGGLEVLYLLANCTKIVSGGWLPLLIALVLGSLMVVWDSGHRRVVAIRSGLEGPVEALTEAAASRDVVRVPGLAVYPHLSRTTTPLALRDSLDFDGVLHEHNVIISVIHENVPHVRHADRIEVTEVGGPASGIHHVDCHVGFNDSQDVPKALALALPRLHGLEDSCEADARYYLPVIQLRPRPGSRTGLRKRVYMAMAGNAADGAVVLHLPPDRTVLVGATIEL